MSGGALPGGHAQAAAPPPVTDRWWMGLAGLPLAMSGALLVLLLIPLMLVLVLPTTVAVHWSAAGAQRD